LEVLRSTFGTEMVDDAFIVSKLLKRPIAVART
jgi:hypothetical protein